jgi:hypothetical protein
MKMGNIPSPWRYDAGAYHTPERENKAVHASRGKAVRAEPIAALYEQRRVHHVGTFPMLEDQMSAFTSDFDRGRAGYSPDHVDALVWALSELMVEPVAGWGLIEYTRLEAEKVTADQVGNRKAAEPPTLSNGGVKMKSPAGTSTAYGMTGTQYNADAEGFFIVAGADVRPLLAAGWVEVRAVVSG